MVDMVGMAVEKHAADLVVGRLTLNGYGLEAKDGCRVRLVFVVGVDVDKVVMQRRDKMKAVGTAEEYIVRQRGVGSGGGFDNRAVET